MTQARQVGVAGSRGFPEPLGRALLRWRFRGMSTREVVSGLADGPDQWGLEESIGLRVERSEVGAWIGPILNTAPEPVWYRSTQRVRVHYRPCLTAETALYPYRGDLGKAGGPVRNEAMANAHPDAIWIVLWDGTSKGTDNMLDNLRQAGATRVEVWTPAALPECDLKVFEVTGEAPYQIVIHGPRESAHVVAVVGSKAPLQGRPWPDVYRSLRAAGATVAPSTAQWGGWDA